MKDTVDFIVIGAQKAGTTSLFEHLRQHPDLYVPPGKELPYFSHEAIRRRGWQDYMGKAFFGADPRRRWGTVTPQYMVGGLWEEPNPTPQGERYDERTVPCRIREQAPHARLIAILRDPADRARAHHRMAVLNHLDPRPFARAVDDLLKPDALEAARREPRETTGYVTWGEYGRILAGYLDTFPREQLLIAFTDELAHDPAGLLSRIYDFIGVPADFIPDNLGVRYRVGGNERRLTSLASNSPLHPWTVQRRLAGSATARRVWRALPERARRQADHALAHVTYRLDLWNRRNARGDGDGGGGGEDEAALRRLAAHFDPDARQLEALTGARPPWRCEPQAGRP